MKILFPIFVFLITLIIFSATGFEGLTYTDNGELAGVAAKLGISHPTGYPLFAILSHLWTYLPLGLKLIHQLNLLSAFFVSLSAVFVYFNSKMIFDNYIINNDLYNSIISTSFALSYSFGSLIWEQSNSLEVYSLHFLFLNLLIYFSLKLYFNYSEKNLLILFFITGLSFTNHLTTILIIPSLLVLLLFDNKLKLRKLDNKTYLIGFLLFLLGLSLYMYLPIRSSMNPVFNWGDVSRGLDKFLYHVQGKQYQVWMFTGSQAIKDNLAKLPLMIFEQFLFIIPFILIGIVSIFKKSKFLFSYFFLAAIVTIIYSSNYTIHDIDPYFALMIISFLYISIFSMIDLHKKFKNIVYVSLLFPISLVVFNYQSNDVSKKDIIPQFTVNLVDNLDSNAVVLSSQWDFWVSAFWYKQQVENYRKDVVLIEKELLRRTWYSEQLFSWYPDLEPSRKEKDAFMLHLQKFENEENYDAIGIQKTFIEMLKSFVDKNIDKRPVYFTYDILQTERELLNSYILKPEGFAYRVYKNENPNHSTKMNTLDIESIIKNKNMYNNHLDNGLFEFLAITYINFARYYIAREDFKSAYKAVQIALRIEPDNVFAKQLYEKIR